MRAAARVSGRCAPGEAHGEGHEPVEEWGFFEVADAVRVEGNGVVAEEQLSRDFDVDTVGVVQERGAKEGEAGVEDEPERERGEEGGARPRGEGGGHWL